MHPCIEWSYIDGSDSLGSYPAEIQHAMGYVHTLRSRWQAEEDMQSVVPSHWVRMLALSDKICTHPHETNAVGVSSCPLKGFQYQYENAACQPSKNPNSQPTADISPRLGRESAEVAISEILVCQRRETSVSTSIAHFFAHTSGCKLRRDLASDSFPQLSIPLDFALIPCPFYRPISASISVRPFVMVGIKGPAYWQKQNNMRSTMHMLNSLREDLASYVHFHLFHLVTWWEEQASESERGSIPDWLSFFAIIQDIEFIRIVSHIPFYKEDATLGYVSYLVDELPFGTSPFPQGSASCQWVMDRVRVVAALLILRHHVENMTRSLIQETELSDMEPRSSCLNCSHCSLYSANEVSEAPDDDNTEYSTCPSSGSASVIKVHNRDRRSVSGARSTSNREYHPDCSCSSQPPSVISCCSSCSSLSSDTSSSDQQSSDYSWSESGDGSYYMEPSSSSLYYQDETLQGPVYNRSRVWDDERRAEVVAWIEAVVPTLQPEDDAYCMTTVVH